MKKLCCANCSRIFTVKKISSLRKYCRQQDCKDDLYNKLYKNKHNLGLSSGSTGAVSELLVSVDLMKKGYEVYRAISPSSFYDLLAVKRDDPKSTLHIEVRTGQRSRKTGTVSFSKQKRENTKIFAIVIYGETVDIKYLPPTAPGYIPANNLIFE